VSSKRAVSALASYERALALRPDGAETLCNRGNLRELTRFEEALASYERALSLRPDYVEALSNRGNTLRELRRFEEALASYERVLALRPDYVEALNNRGIALLLAGDYKGGRRDFEWRWLVKDFPSRRSDISAPFWQGEE
jgi:tetratricopeptide (TPR) repeat protein